MNFISTVQVIRKMLLLQSLVFLVFLSETTEATEALAEPAPVAEPVLGMGLNGISDWSTQYPFIDIMKTARPWLGHLKGQWGGFEIDRLVAGGYLDAQGWPLSIPPEVDRLETFILTDLPADATSMAGRYILTFEGDGLLEVAGRVSRVRYGKNRIEFDFTPGDGLVAIVLRRTDPGGSGNHIRNIRVVREDHLQLARLGFAFNPSWLERVQDMRVLRFMDWAFTNGSLQQVVEDRPRLDDFSYAWRGVPLEVMVDLSNQVGADPWFNIPHMADDTLVRVMAELVRERLSPSLKAYLEYSNEVWNWQFPQALWAQEQAQKRWGRSVGQDGWIQYAGMRASQIADIWTEVFGDETEKRLVRVISTHPGWMGLEQPLLNADYWVAENPNHLPPYKSFDAYAVTGYLGLQGDPDDASTRVLGYLSRGKEYATVALAEEVRAGALSMLKEEYFPYHYSVATDYGLRLIMYEGGTHIVGVGAWTENESLTEFFNYFNYTSEMAELYADLLLAWHQAGGTLFNAFVDVAKPSKWGSWGHLRHLGDSNPRWDALMAFNTAGGATWEDRAPGTFLNGVMRHAPEGGGLVEAAHPRDILIGGPGDDLLVAMGCCVRMHGGAGVNTALLSGTPEAYDFLWMGDVMLVTARDGSASEMRLADIQRITFADAPGAVMELTPPKPETEG